MVAAFAETARAQFTITLQPNTLPAATNGTPYSQTVTAVGGNAPYTFSLLSGSLPAGLSLAANGDITGTPTVSGSPTFQIQADDVDGNSGFRTYSLSVGTPGSLGINPGSLPNGSVGVPYNQPLSGTGGTGPYTFSISGGSLPTGMSMTAGGVISGTPTVPGPFNFTVDVRDSGGSTGTAAYTINIGTNSLTVSPPTLPNGTQGTPYTATVSASGGTGPYTFSIASGSLPTGLSLNGTTGDITGTPTVPGPFNFTVRAIDSVGNTGAQAYTVNIGGNILTVTPPVLPNGTQGTPYSQTLGASGGTGPYTFAVTAGALPNGLSLSAAGVLSGTPTVAGPFNFTVQASDTLFNTGSQAYTVTINAAPLTIGPPSLPNATVGTPYNQNVTASGGAPPYSYAVVSGALPAGLGLNAGTGAITGTPTTPGSYSFTVQATDAAPNIAAQAYTINVGSNILTVAPATLPNGTLNTAYNQTVTASGGTGPYTFSISAGALPAGLSMSAGGVITGTPSAGGASAFTVLAQDSVGNTGSRPYNVNIGTSTLTINPATLPAPMAGRPYSQTVTGSGGTAPYTYAIVGGALPPGLTLNTATGVISGTPTGLGTSTFTVQATDINGNIGSRAYTLTNRADPALDPEVQGLISAQVATTQRFASAQINNVTQHLAGLHDHFNPCSFNMGFAPPIDPARPNSGAPYGQYGGPYGNSSAAYSPYGNSPYAPPMARNGGTACAMDWASSLAFWTAGSFQFGSMTPSGVTNSNHFNTGGLTAGVDWRVSDDLIAGVALGYGADRSDIGLNGTRSDASSYSGTLYASLRLFDPLFLDAAVGYGTLSFDNHRFVTGEGTFASGSRTGSYWFGALTASLELGNDRFKFAPYVKGDFMSATLGQYAETGSTAQLLTYNEMKTEAVSASIGLRGSIDIPASFGTFTPTARVEFRQTSQSEYSQAMYYSDLGPAVSSAFGQPSNVRNMATGAFGFRVRSPGGLSVELEYGISAGTGSYKAQSVRAAVRMPF